MPDPTDVYSDQFQLTVSPYGSVINFSLSHPTPPAPGSMPQSEKQVSVRMSLEHLKVMAFILARQLRRYERDTGVNVQVPTEVLNALQIGPEDWAGFWRG